MSIILTTAPAKPKPSGKMYLSANQLNLVHAEWTLVALDVIKTNFADGIEDTVNHKITPGVAGFYDVKGQATFAEVVADKRYYAAIRLNGTTWLTVSILFSGAAWTLSINPCGHFYLSATDYIELKVCSFADANTVDVFGGDAYTFMSVQRVR